MKDIESYSSYESEIEEGTELRKRKTRAICTKSEHSDKSDNLELLLFSEKYKEKFKVQEEELGIRLNELKSNEERMRQIDMIKLETDNRVEESEKKLLERILAVEQNLQLEIEVNETDLQREIKKYVAIVKQDNAKVQEMIQE